MGFYDGNCISCLFTVDGQWPDHSPSGTEAIAAILAEAGTVLAELGLRPEDFRISDYTLYLRLPAGMVPVTGSAVRSTANSVIAAIATTPRGWFPGVPDRVYDGIKRAAEEASRRDAAEIVRQRYYEQYPDGPAAGLLARIEEHILEGLEGVAS